MARLSSNHRSRSRTRSRTAIGTRPLPWVIAGQAALILRDHWRRVSPADRARLAELLRQSKGRPMHLTPQQRTELAAIVQRADIPGLGRDLAPVASRRAAGRRTSLLRRG